MSGSETGDRELLKIGGVSLVRCRDVSVANGGGWTSKGEKDRSTTWREMDWNSLKKLSFCGETACGGFNEPAFSVRTKGEEEKQYQFTQVSEFPDRKLTWKGEEKRSQKHAAADPGKTLEFGEENYSVIFCCRLPLLSSLIHQISYRFCPTSLF